MGKEMITNDRDGILLVSFGSVIDDVYNKNYYEFKKIRVQKYMYKRILKSTETLAVLQIQNPQTEVPKYKDVKSDKIQIDAKIVLIDLKTPIPTYLFPKYNYTTGCCNSCKNVVLQSKCKE